ncbi:MAG: putative nucleotidyltransferase with HDIG domain [Colwellia polaris]|jgi:putative nucleotidyltransferase with HDIG domain
MLTGEELQTLKERLRKEFSDYIEKGGGKNFRYHHLTSVRKYALKLADNVDEEVDIRVLEAAALFHDIGRSEDIEDGFLDPFENHEGHDEQGAEIVPEYIDDVLDKEKVEKVKKLIQNHHSEPETLEGKILQDADHLYSYGVHDLWRMIHYSSQTEREIDELPGYFWEELVPRRAEEIETFNFDKTREVAEKRLIRYQEAVRQFQDEIEAEDF